MESPPPSYTSPYDSHNHGGSYAYIHPRQEDTEYISPNAQGYSSFGEQPQYRPQDIDHDSISTIHNDKIEWWEWPLLILCFPCYPCFRKGRCGNCNCGAAGPSCDCGGCDCAC